MVVIGIDTKTVIIVLIPSILSSLVAIASLIINFLRERRRKDDRIWELAKELTLSLGDLNESPDKANECQAGYAAKHFRLLYENLKAIDIKESEKPRQPGKESLLNQPE